MNTTVSNKRKILLVTGPLLVALVSSYLYLGGGRYVSTENAFVKADKVMISTEVSGPVNRILVAENTPVTTGQTLFTIDDASFRTALERVEARVQKVHSDIEALKAAYHARQAELQLAETNLAFAQREYHRQEELVSKHFVSQTSLDNVRHNAELAQQQINVIHQDLVRIAENLNGNPAIAVEEHPSYQEARAELAQAQLNLDHTTIKAPFDGIASNVPKPGQYLGAGSPGMALVAAKQMWIEANFNETDLTHVSTGQKVSIHIDTYPDHDWHGTVQSISPATGAEFSILPPQNATGNWVKVVQRIPVRIAIETEGNGQAPELRVGMSATVKIDTGHTRAGRWMGEK